MVVIIFNRELHFYAKIVPMKRAFRILFHVIKKSIVYYYMLVVACFALIPVCWAYILNRYMLIIFLIIAVYIVYRRQLARGKTYFIGRMFLMVAMSSVALFTSGRYSGTAHPYQCNRIIKQDSVKPIVYYSRLCSKIIDKRAPCIENLLQPYDLAYDYIHKKLYIITMYGITIVNPSKNRDLKNMTVTSAQRLIWIPERGLMIVPGYLNKRLDFFETNAEDIIKSFSTEEKSKIAIVYDEKDILYILGERRKIITYSFEKNNIKVYNYGEKIANHLHSINYSPKHRRLYIGNYFPGNMYAIDTDTMKIIRSKLVSAGIMGILVDEEKGELYVSSPLESKILVLDSDTFKVKRKMKVGYIVRDIDWNPETGLLFAGNYADGTVDVLDMELGHRLKRVYIGPLVRGVYFSRETNRLFACSLCGAFEIDISKIKQ